MKEFGMYPSNDDDGWQEIVQQPMQAFVRVWVSECLSLLSL